MREADLLDGAGLPVEDQFLRSRTVDLGDGFTKPHRIGRGVVPEVVVMPNDGQAGFLERVREYPVAQVAIDEIDRSQAARS